MQILHQTNSWNTLGSQETQGPEWTPYWVSGHLVDRGVGDASVPLLMPQGSDFFCRKGSQAKEAKSIVKMEEFVDSVEM